MFGGLYETGDITNRDLSSGQIAYKKTFQEKDSRKMILGN